MTESRTKMERFQNEVEERMFGDWLFANGLEDTKQARDAWVRWKQMEETEAALSEEHHRFWQ